MIEASDYPNRAIGRRILAPSDAVDRQVVAVNLTESPLGWLARRGMLTALQVAAGERLRGDHARAGLGARVTMRWEAAPSGAAQRGGGGAEGQTMAAIDAKRRFDAAMAFVGPGLSDILWRVACEGDGLAVAGKGRHGLGSWCWGWRWIAWLYIMKTNMVFLLLTIVTIWNRGFGMLKNCECGGAAARLRGAVLNRGLDGTRAFADGAAGEAAHRGPLAFAGRHNGHPQKPGGAQLGPDREAVPAGARG